MLHGTPEPAALIQDELKLHPALCSFDITPAPEEMSHAWHSHLHFTGHESTTGREIVIKTGVTERESYWTRELASVDSDIFPELLAAGHVTAPDGETQVGFLASERIPYPVIGPLWEAARPELMLSAAARFYQAARRVTPQHLSRLALSSEDLPQWASLGRLNPPGDWQTVAANAERDFAWLEDNCPFEVCHGDLHVGNALSRNPSPDGPILLIDFNPIVQPWVFDAAWLEACEWRQQAERGIGYMARRLAQFRLALGLDVLADDVLEKATRIALSWYAVRNWDPDHLEFMPGFETATGTFINAGASLLREKCDEH